MDKPTKETLNKDSFHDLAIWQLVLYIITLVVMAVFSIIAKS
jgi:hypothetical protein